jgi:hypothetical protein
MEAGNIPTAADITSQIGEPRLLRLFEYWVGRKGERRFPARSDIDPIDFKYMLGSILLIDVLPDPLRFRIRLHGSELVRRGGYDLTGKVLDVLPPTDYRKHVIEQCRSLVHSREPAVVHQDRVLDGRDRVYEALWLPLSEDGTNVTMLICGLIYHDRRW